MHSSSHSSSTRQAAAFRGCGGGYRLVQWLDLLASSCRRGTTTAASAVVAVRWLAYQIIGSSASCAVDCHITWPAPLCHKGLWHAGLESRQPGKQWGTGREGFPMGAHVSACLPRITMGQNQPCCGVTAGNRSWAGRVHLFWRCTAHKWCVLFYVVVCDHASGPQRGAASWLRVPTVCITDMCGKLLCYFAE